MIVRNESETVYLAYLFKEESWENFLGKENCRKFRELQVLSGAFFSVPHRSAVATPGSDESNVLFVFSGLLYIIGAMLYALRVPERWFPGKCDIWVRTGRGERSGELFYRISYFFLSSFTLIKYSTFSFWVEPSSTTTESPRWPCIVFPSATVIYKLKLLTETIRPSIGTK